MFGDKTIHINLPFTRSRKSKDVEIVAEEIILTYKFCTVPINVSRMLTDCVKDASHRDVWKCWSFRLNSRLDEKE